MICIEHNSACTCTILLSCTMPNCFHKIPLRRSRDTSKFLCFCALGATARIFASDTPSSEQPHPRPRSGGDSWGGVRGGVGVQPTQPRLRRRTCGSCRRICKVRRFPVCPGYPYEYSQCLGSSSSLGNAFCSVAYIYNYILQY